MAAPDGADLLTSCRHALENGFASIQGRMCQWYTLPCDCHPDQQPAPPPVCLPPDVPHSTLAQQVITGLQEKPELQEMRADMAAAIILSVHYPCSESSR